MQSGQKPERSSRTRARAPEFLFVYLFYIHALNLPQPREFVYMIFVI